MRSYRPDIDGLRAVAVSSVILYHASVPGFSGGFLGVDIFFVISGYLITGILLPQGTDSKVDLLRFYERRIRRIVPALVVVLAACFAAALLILTPIELTSFSRTAAAATSFILNLQLALGVPYWDVAAKHNPLLHLWSLSVEEQFYLLYPAFLWLVLKFKRNALPFLIAAGVLLSLAFSEWRAHIYPATAFYLPHSRAWELGLGALVALKPLRAPLPRALSEAVTIIALLVIAATVACYSDQTIWPGLHAAVPCIATALLLGVQAVNPTLTGRLLGLKPVVAIGLISYSLYLWHWPVFVFFTRYALRQPSAFEYAALIALSVALATLSWRYVEQPFRRSRGGFSRRSVFRAAAVSAAVLLAGSGFIYSAHGLPSRFTSVQRHYFDYLDISQQRRFRREAGFGTCHVDIDDPKPYNFSQCFVPATDRPNVLVWGDSFAMHYIAGFRPLALQSGAQLIQATYDSCRPLLVDAKIDTQACLDFNKNLLAHIDGRISIVVISARWYDGFSYFPHVLDLIRKIVRKGPHVVVFGPPPEYDLPVALCVERFVATGDRSYLQSRQHLRPDWQSTDAAMRQTFGKEPGVTYISVFDTMCKSGQCPIMTPAREPVESDFGHLTVDGSRLFGKKLWPKIMATLPR